MDYRESPGYPGADDRTGFGLDPGNEKDGVVDADVGQAKASRRAEQIQGDGCLTSLRYVTPTQSPTEGHHGQGNSGYTRWAWRCLGPLSGNSNRGPGVNCFTMS